MTQITKEAIEAASATYWQNHWKIFSENAKRPIRETMEKALEAALPFLPIAGEGKALDEEQIAKLIWQHLPSKVAEEMTRDKHPPLFPQAEYTVATLSAKNFVEAIIDLVTPSSPGKDGGQEVEAVSDRGEPCPHCKGEGCQPGDPEGAPLEACDYCNGSGKKRDTHPAGTALVEALEALIAAVGDWSRPTGANGMVPASENHPLCVAAKQGREALAAGKETVNESVV